VFRRAGFVAVVGLVLSASTVAAANQTVKIQGSVYSPTPVTVSRGNTVTWSNLDAFTHSATADGDSTLFNTGTFTSPPKSKVFTQAATFAYHCVIHGSMHGKVKVRMGVSPASAAKGTTFTFGLASATIPTGYTHDVQVSRNGATFVSLTSTTSQTKTYKPTLTGNYRVRTRLHKTSNNFTTGWSPVSTFTVN
jgi:plastocyanin